LIDFRYHLVSIVAVFLALAVGIIVGSQALSPVAQKVLDTEVKAAQRANHALTTQNNQLSQLLGADGSFAEAASGALLTGLLTGQSVVLVVAPGADSQTVTGVTSALRTAGAVVTGQVVLQPQFLDTSSVTEQALTTAASTAASSLIPATVKLPTAQPDPQIPGQQAAAQVIAAAIVGKTGFPTMTTAQSQAVLNEFGREGYLQVTAASGGAAALSGQATMAVVIAPSTVPVPRVSGPSDLALVSFAQDLQEAGRGAVLASAFSGSGPGSAIAIVSGGGAGTPLSTVDMADSAPGQIMVAQALRELLSSHAAPTSYGAGPGVVPSPAPSPLPSPSASSAPPRKKA